MATSTYAFTRGLDYASIVTASEKVAWTVDGIFQGRQFDASKPIVPASWVRTQGLAFLTDLEQLTLNHCRAFSYVHLFGHFEEFIPPHLSGLVQQDWYDDRAHLRALLRFSEEEMKHQQLFLRAESTLEQACGYSFGRYFDHEKSRLTAFSDAILAYPPLPRFLLLLAFEFGGQRHYVESIQDHTETSGDALYIDILKAHWVEENQHTKSDRLEIAQLSQELSPEQLTMAFDDIVAMGGLVETTIMGQVGEEIETLQRITGRTFADTEETLLRETLHESLRAILIGVSLTHPGFAKVALELSKEGAAKLGITL